MSREPLFRRAWVRCRRALVMALAVVAVWQAASCEPAPGPGSRGQAAGDAKGVTAVARGRGGEIQADMARAKAALKAGDFEHAIALLREADARCAETGAAGPRMEVLLDLAAAEQGVGNYGAAETAAGTCLRLAEGAKDAGRQVEALDAMGTVMTCTGRIEHGEQLFQRAMAIAEANHELSLYAVVMNDAGNAKRAAGNDAGALEDYMRAASIAARTPDRAQAARIAVNIASVGRALGRARGMQDVKALVTEAAEAVKPLPASRDKAFDLLTIGLTAEELAVDEARKPGTGIAPPVDLQSDAAVLAGKAFADAEEVGRTIGDPAVVSWAAGEEGHLLELGGDDAQALRMTHKAELAAQGLGGEPLYRWQWQAGRILARQGKKPEALTAYQNAVATLTPIRADLILGYGNRRSSGGKLAYRESVGPLLFGLADLTLQNADNLSGPPAQAALLEARQTIEQLRSSEIQDYFKDDCVVTARSSIKDIGTLDPHTAVVYFIPLTDRTEILVQTAGGISRHKVPVGSAALFDTVHRFRKRLETLYNYSYLTEAGQLYDWLIRPLEADLKGQNIDTLVFVPDGALLGVPMGSLFDGKDYLIAHYAVAVTPGLTLIDPKPIPRGNARVLAAGLSLGKPGFIPLQNVPREVSEVEKIYGGRMLLDQTFTEQNLETEIESYPFSIIHVASHAQFAGESADSFLLAFDKKLSLDDLQRLIGPTAVPSHGRLRPIELLTLSACQTAAGNDRAALGLAGVAIKAGARSVIATLWSVEDESQESLICDVYARLRDDPTLSKAKALQQAQLKLMKRRVHAYYWSPHIVIGNWL